jgi:hypothetical protein
MASTANHSLVRRIMTLTVLPMIIGIGACSHQSAQSNASPLPPAKTVPAMASNPATTSYPAPSSPKQPSHEHIRGIATASVITIHGKIVSVDRPKKRVTIEGPGGKEITVHVYNPYNLEHAQAGQRFVAKFYEIITIVRQKPNPSMPPVSVAQGLATAEPGDNPGSAFGRSLQVVTTVSAVNPVEHTIVIKGPDGAEETVKVGRHTGLRHVKVGDQIVITLTDVVAVELKPEAQA